MKQIFDALAAKISKERIQKYTEEIHRLEGDESYDNYKRSTDCCLELMRESGFEQVERHALAADGETTWFDCIMPQAWDTCGQSTLTIINPDIPEEKRLLADSFENQFAINPWSAPTPEGGLDCVVINWDTAQKDPAAIAGKFVYINRYTSVQYKYISDRGAAGLITSNLILLDEFPDSYRWCNGTGFTGWYHAKGERRLPMFSLRADRAKYLQDLLAERDNITVHAEAKTRISDGEIYTLTGVLPGKSDQEITLIAHMYEPFLADDAAGGVIICELVRAIKELIAEGVLPELERSLRIVLSMERYGFSEFFQNRERNRRTLTVISMDSACHFPGSDTFPETKLRLSSIFQPSFLDLLLPELYRKLLPQRRLDLEKGNLSDDTFCSDDWIGIPSVWFHSADVRYHHSTCHKFMDADWDLAADIARFAGAFTGALAIWQKKQFKELLEECSMLAGRELQNIIQSIQSGNSCGFEAAEAIRLHGTLMQKRLLSLNAFAPGCVTENDVVFLQDMAEQAAAQLDAEPPQLTEIRKKAANTFVRRLVPNCLMSIAKAPLAERKNSPIPDTLYILLDETRSVYDAARIFKYYFGTEITDQELDRILDHLDYLEKYQYVELKKS